VIRFGRAGEGYVEKKMRISWRCRRKNVTAEISEITVLSFEVFNLLAGNYGEPAGRENI